MSEINQIDNIESKRRNNLGIYLTLPMFIIFILAIVWLYIEVGRIKFPRELLGITTLANKVEDNSSKIETNNSKISILASQVDANTSNISMVASQVDLNSTNISSLSYDISNIDSYLSYVASLAENANQYAHSHTYSDKRLKQNVNPLSNTLSSILQLQGVSFYWEENLVHQLNLPNARQVGFIAQEVEQVYPELVANDSLGYKSVDYAMFSPILVEAIKEQQTQLNDLQQQNSQLEERIDELEKLVQANCQP